MGVRLTFEFLGMGLLTFATPNPLLRIVKNLMMHSLLDLDQPDKLS